MFLQIQSDMQGYNMVRTKVIIKNVLNVFLNILEKMVCIRCEISKKPDLKYLSTKVLFWERSGQS